MTDETEKNRLRSVDELDAFTPEERRKLREILRMEPELQQVVKSKMITQGVVNFVGELAKYITGLIALVIAYRQFIGK